MFRASCHFLLALLAGFVIPDDYTTHFNAIELTPIATIPMGIKILYSFSFTYHLACYFFEAQKKKDWRVYLLIAFLVGSCWIERFTFPIVVCIITIVINICKEPKFDIMNIHHILTIVLILGSWSYHLTTVGSLIMFVNDVTDVPMFLVRKVRANEKSESIKQIVLAIIVFVLWFIYRVLFMSIIFGKMCIYYYQLENQLSIVMNLTCVSLLLAMFTLISFNTFWVYLLSCKLGKAFIKRM